uniref:Uncharacterized protein n=1 Tax=Myotis myotis TaxID=51298 RepID=A0A7J7SRP2_MYOMY|nr:hypothetical protein mMyoMyo1_009309 [Myotis myotis]
MAEVLKLFKRGQFTVPQTFYTCALRARDESAAKQDRRRRQKHPAGRINVFGGPQFEDPCSMVLPRKEMFLRSQAGGSLTTVPNQSVEEPRLNLRLLCSAGERKSVDRLVMMGLNDQNSLLTAPAKNRMRIERREERPKSPALELRADPAAHFLL